MLGAPRPTQPDAISFSRGTQLMLSAKNLMDEDSASGQSNGEAGFAAQAGGRSTEARLARLEVGMQNVADAVKDVLDKVVANAEEMNQLQSFLKMTA